MTLKDRLYKINPFSAYVHLVSALMLGQVIVSKLNDEFDWVIRIQFLKILPQSLHQPYFNCLFLLLLFSIVNIFLNPIIGIAVGVYKKNLFTVIISFLAAIAYYLYLREMGDGII
jgi:hypothetical protein